MKLGIVEGHDGFFQIIRRGEKNTRVIPLGGQESLLVPTSKVSPLAMDASERATQLGSVEDSAFRSWMKTLLSSWGSRAEWPSLIFWLLESEFQRQRSHVRPYPGDVFKDRDDEVTGRADECDIHCFGQMSEEKLTQALYDRCHFGSQECEPSSGCFEISLDRFWLLGYEFPTCGGPADLVGLKDDGSLGVFECKAARNGYSPIGAMLEGLDYLSAMTQEANFSNLSKGFDRWREKLKKQNRLPKGFEEVVPTGNARHSVIVLAPQEYYGLYVRSERGLKGYPQGWAGLSQCGRKACEALSFGLAICDFYKTTRGEWLEGSNA